MTTFVFLHDGYADWELGFLLPELVFRKRLVKTFGITADVVCSMGGLRVTPDLPIDKVDLKKAEAIG